MTLFETKQFPIARTLFAAVLALCAMASPGAAQIVALVNGIPITSLEIEHRSKLTQLMSNKAQSRQEALNDLIDDRLKVSIAKRYNFEITQAEIDQSYAGMAQRARMTPDQLGQMLKTRGTSEQAMKAKVRADLTWTQMVRARFGASLQVGEADINSALQSRGSDEKASTSYTYVLYPIVMIVPGGSGEGAAESRRREAEGLRSRFQSCTEGLRLARALRDVAVREPITRTSADMPQQLRDVLGQMEVGRLTAPEPSAQGLQMFALCEKKEAGANESAAKREVREEIFSKRFEAQSKKYLDELRRQAMIEYR